MQLPTRITQWFKKQRKMGMGVINTYVRKVGVKYSSENWWDKVFYISGISSDASTISKHTSQVVSKYHYASIELGLLALLFNHGIEIKDKRVCDIGSGSGHWIDFYDSLDASSIAGIDVSRTACDYLSSRFKNQSNISIACGKAGELKIGRFDIVNAIGVMFHVVDDAEWAQTICNISESLDRGGIFVVGGHFGWFNHLNVQFDHDMHVNKRLRSSRHWIRTLKDNGFTKVFIWRNRAYLKINWLVPESNLLIAFK